MTGNTRNGCSGPGSGDGAHIVMQKISSGLRPDQQCGKVIWSGGCWHKLGFRVIWGCSTCPALSPGERAEIRNLQPKWRLSRILTEREFQILNQSKDTNRGVQGIGFWGAELVEQAKGSHHAGSIYCYWEEAVRVWLWFTRQRCLILVFVVLSGKLFVIIMSCINSAKFMTSSLHISGEWILCSSPYYLFFLFF